MANLIITVIAIALVAVASLMGAYYGGTAFVEGQAKAQANTLITQSEQIAAAWTMRATDDAGAWGQYDVANLATRYLQAAPTPPAAASSGAWTLVRMATNATAAGANVNNAVRVTMNGTGAAGICLEVARISANDPTLAAIPAFANTSPNVTIGADRTFDCRAHGAVYQFVRRVNSNS
jgi:hypothetical protein